MRAIGACVLALATVAPAAGSDAPAAAAPPRVGQPQLRPDLPRREHRFGFLLAAPQATITEPGRLTLAFATAEPTPPVTVYIGLNTLAEDLDVPHYRKRVNEAGESIELRTEHTVSIDLRAMTALLPSSPYEPRLLYRIEAWIPSERQSRFFDGRVYFDPKTLGDTENIVEGPYVDLVTERSAVISWRTDRPAEGAVLLGERVVPSPAGTLHEVTIEGLTPRRAYPYRVRAGRTTTREYAFTTAGGDRFAFAALVDCRAPRGDDGVGGGDTNVHGVNARALHALGADLYRRGADFVLAAGDLIYGYTTSVSDFELQLESFRRAMQPISSRIPVYEGMGNHESLTDAFDDGSRWGLQLDKQGEASAEAVFARLFVNPTDGPEPEVEGAPPYRENVYSFRRGNALFIMLNNTYWVSSNPHTAGGNLEGFILPKQIEWLRSRLAAAERDRSIAHVFVAAHEPPFPNGPHARDAMWWSGGDTNRDKVVDARDVPIVEARNTLWSLISASPKVVALIAGDEHAYARTLITDQTPAGHKRGLDGREVRFAHPVWQITSGGAGAPFYDRVTNLPWSGAVAAYSVLPHYALFRVDGRRVDLEVYGMTGQRIDSVRLR